MRISATEAATDAVRRVRAAGRDDLVVVLSNGCCDATAPYLYDRYVADPDTQPVGAIDGVTVLAPNWLATMYRDDEAFVIDCETGVLDDSMSLETEHDMRLVLRAPVAPERR